MKRILDRKRRVGSVFCPIWLDCCTELANEALSFVCDITTFYSICMCSKSPSDRFVQEELDMAVSQRFSKDSRMCGGLHTGARSLIMVYVYCLQDAADAGNPFGGEPDQLSTEEEAEIPELPEAAGAAHGAAHPAHIIQAAAPLEYRGLVNVLMSVRVRIGDSHGFSGLRAQDFC